MNLYTVDTRIFAILRALEPDTETGEVPEDEEQLLSELRSLGMARQDMLENMAKVVLNLRAEAGAISAEIERLSARKKAAETRATRYLDILSHECPETTDLTVATLRWRRSSRVEVGDSEMAVAWLMSNGHEDCCRIRAPEIAKDAVRKLLKKTAVPGVKLQEYRSASLS